MYLIQKDRDDIIIINSETSTIKFLNDLEKIEILEIFPQLCDVGLKGITVEDLPGEETQAHIFLKFSDNNPFESDYLSWIHQNIYRLIFLW